MPAREDLWAEYVELRRNRAPDDPDARNAHRFYLERREAMDAGAVVSNPHRFDSRPLEDGEPSEVSALQACYNVIADRGQDAFDAEYQNNPKPVEGPIESGLTPHRIMTQLSGYPRLVVPPKCVLLTCGIDVRKSGLHYVVLGVEQDFTGHVILHDFHATHGTTYGIDDGVDIAIERALLDLHEQLKLQEWMKENGEILDLSLSLADSGYRQQAVYSAAAKIGDKFYPSRGHGKSEGCTQTNFSEQQQRTPDRKPFDGAFLTREGKIWLCHVDADRWKRFVHDRFLTAPGRPGCFDMFGVERSDGGRQTPDERAHQTFANQICNESEVDQVVKGVLRRRFKQRGKTIFWMRSRWPALPHRFEGFACRYPARRSPQRCCPSTPPLLLALVAR
jgi:hypothetical protein